MTSNIHNTAIVDKNAKIGQNVTIGPYCVIGPNVEIGDNSLLQSHIVVNGYTKLGKNTRVFPFASLGNETQDLKFKGEVSYLEIGDNNTIREYVTMNPGSDKDSVTKVGNNCLFMIGVHIAHDCMIGDNVIMSNQATLAGYVTVGNNAIIGGLSAVHQRVRIGDYAMIGGMSPVDKDVIPYGLVTGERAHLVGLNLVGLKRNNFSRETIQNIREVYDSLFIDRESKQVPLNVRVRELIPSYQNNKDVAMMLEFLKYDTDRPICQPLET